MSFRFQIHTSTFSIPALFWLFLVALWFYLAISLFLAWKHVPPARVPITGTFSIHVQLHTFDSLFGSRYASALISITISQRISLEELNRNEHKRYAKREREIKKRPRILKCGRKATAESKTVLTAFNKLTGKSNRKRHITDAHTERVELMTVDKRLRLVIFFNGFT